MLRQKLRLAAKRVGTVLFLASLMLMAASFAGRLHPAGDSLAVFRFWISVLVMVSVVLILTRWRRLLAVVALLGAFFVEPVIETIAPAFQPEPGRVTLYQKNLWYANPEQVVLALDIRATAPDIVVLQELSRHNMPLFEGLKADFQTAAYCGDRGASIGILTRFQRTDTPPICMNHSGLSAIEVTDGTHPFWIVGIHLRWPWPKEQPQNLKAILPVLEGLRGPVVVAGDFNAVPWSSAVFSIQRATRTDRVGPILRTLVGHSPYLRIPIDHVLVPGGQGRLETRPLLGSDHLGVLARFDL